LHIRSGVLTSSIRNGSNYRAFNGGIIIEGNKPVKSMKINYLDASIGEVVHWTESTTFLKSEVNYGSSSRERKVSTLAESSKSFNSE
jgi:hypothetical protein